MLCFVAFAVIYYPKMYGPKLYQAAKAKLVEYAPASSASRPHRAPTVLSPGAPRCARSHTLAAALAAALAAPRSVLRLQLSCTRLQLSCPRHAACAGEVPIRPLVCPARYKIDQHASKAFGKLQSTSAGVYAAARSSSVTSKGFEYLSHANERASSAYRAAAQNALVASIASKGGDLVDKGRVKLAAKLVELRDGTPAPARAQPAEPLEPSTPV